MVKSCISPDGEYLVSGSEDGKPFIWNAMTYETYKVRRYACKFMDMVSDVDWNPRYNMFAVCGFGHSYPILVYVYERTEDELKAIYISGQAISSVDQPKENMGDIAPMKDVPAFDKENIGGIGGGFNERMGAVSGDPYDYKKPMVS